jgi:hypothetical protein
MGVQGLNLRKIHWIERQTGLYVLRALVNNGHDHRIWQFVTNDHQHGVIHRELGEYRIEDASDVVHNTSCEWLFGDHARPRDASWGSYCYWAEKPAPPTDPSARWHLC